MEKNYMETARAFKSLCDPQRLKILDMLNREELCACDILEQMDIGQSTLSYHMKIFVDGSIVNRRREGKRTFYILEAEGCKRAKGLIVRLPCIKRNKMEDYDIKNQGGCK